MKKAPYETALISRLDSLILSSKAQEIKQLPCVPDVSRMVIRANKVYTIERTFNFGPLTAAVAGTYGVIAPSLSSLPAVADFTALFDQYRIAQMRVRFEPVSSAGYSTTQIQSLVTAIDYDDATPPTLETDLLQYQTVMITSPGVPFERVLNPHAAIAAYSGAFTSYAQFAGWIDVASPTVQYYGLKYAIPPSTALDILYNVYVSLIINLKNPR
jgi:hypothetical protein